MTGTASSRGEPSAHGRGGAPAGSSPVATSASPRGRTVDAAFALFDEQGYDSTTVDEIAARAGLSRSTFFRMFATKEEVIFPDHDDLHARIQARLDSAGSEHSIVAVTEAARMVLEHYLAEGELARIRYRLTRSVPALRDREIADQQGYQRLFREFVRAWVAQRGGTELRAELMANAVVTAHNVVLRRWLRRLTEQPRREFDAAMDEVFALYAAPPGEDGRTTVVVLRSDRSLDTVLPAIRRALRD